MIKFCLAIIAILITSAHLAAQKTGDQVMYQCFCLGQEWVKAEVIEESYLKLRIRWGNLPDQTTIVNKDSPKVKAISREWKASPMQLDFYNTMRGKYYRPVQVLAHYYDPQYIKQPGWIHMSEWQNAMTILSELDNLCRTKYRGIEDFQIYLTPGEIDVRFGQWCEIAARRNELEPLARAGVAKENASLGYTGENLRHGDQPNNPLMMEVQEMIFNRAKWRAAKLASLKPHFAKYGLAVPPDATAEAEKKADALWKIVERDAPNRSFKQPPWHDASVEAFVKRKIAARFPGAQVVKIGLDYRTWVERESHSLVASDDYFNYYKVSYNSYKRGEMLIKIPGRPFCQMQDFVVGRGKGALIDAGIGGSGVFMRCD